MKVIKRIILLVVIVILVTVGVFIGKGYSMYKTAIDKMGVEAKKESIIENLGEDYTYIDELPKDYVNAVIAVEDHRFYEHKGVDIIAIGRIIKNAIIKREIKEGGSTITQQLAKNIYFTQEKTLTRKIAEIFMAAEIEKNCSKTEIFEMYVNTSYFGSGYYCVKKAANGYFGKEPIDMTISESTLLAGVPNAPSVYSPKTNPDLAKQRQKQVINKMVKYEYLTQEEANAIMEEP